MNSQQKIFLLLIIILIVLSLISFVVSRFLQQSPSTPQETLVIPANVEKISQIQQNPKFSSQPTAVFSYFGEFPFPKELPVYSYTYTAEIFDSVKKHTASVSFATPPKEIAKGIWDFMDKDDRLTYDVNTHALSFSLAFDATTPSRFETPVKVFDSLSKSSLFPSYIRIQGREIPYQEGEGGSETQKESSSLEYQYLLSNGYPLIFDTISLYPSFFRESLNVGVSSYIVHIPPTTIEQKETRSLYSLSQMLELLNSGKGALIRVSDSGQTELYDAVPKYSSVTIQSIYLLYLPLKNDGLLVPVYRILGRGVGTSVQQVELFLRATE